MVIEGRARELIEAPNFCFVGTIREDGTPHVIPVWVDLEGDRVLLNSAKGRDWPRNAERDPRVTLTVPDKDNVYEYVTIRGKVIDTTTDGADAHIDAMAKKYMDKDEYPFRQEGEVRIKLYVEAEHVKHRG